MGGEFVAPWVESGWESSPCGIFPLGFGRELFAGPGGVGLGVIPGDVGYGVVEDFFDVAAGAFGVLPGGVFDSEPPWVFGMWAVAGFLLFEEPCEDEGPTVLFGVGGVFRGFYELLKLLVGDSVGVDLEGFEVDFANGAFGVGSPCFGAVGAHVECASGEFDHWGVFWHGWVEKFLGSAYL